MLFNFSRFKSWHGTFCKILLKLCASRIKSKIFHSIKINYSYVNTNYLCISIYSIELLIVNCNILWMEENFIDKFVKIYISN